MRSHTPAPWFATQSDEYLYQVKIKAINDSAPIAIVYGNLDDSENGANSRLIAASPDLLEALEELVSIVHIHEEATSNDFAWAELDIAYKAIKKAIGES